MENKRFKIFQENDASKKHVKYFAIFLWLSLTLHLYGLWGLSAFKELIRNQEAPSQNYRIQNIILETKTSSLVKPKEAVISDKNNINQAPDQDINKPEEYNVVNPNPALAQGQGGEVSYIPQKAIQSVSEDTKKLEEMKEKGTKLQEKVQKTPKQLASEGGGETAPTLFTPKKIPVINLYNNGRASLATQSKEYADYFIAMQKKIEKYHKEFFPIYQYYQGLLKDGEVVVEYNLDRKGTVKNAKIVSSYGSDTVDEASLNSIIYAKNFGALPEDFQDQEEITIRFHFIYLSR